MQQFLYSAWQRSNPTSVFFNRIIKDYSYLINESAEHWKLVVPSDISALKDGLVNLISKQDEQGAQVTIARLKSLAAEHPDEPGIVIALAKGLFELSNKQDEQSARDVDFISFHHVHPLVI